MFMSLLYKKKREKKSLLIFFISKDYVNWIFSFLLHYSPKHPYYSRIIPLSYFMSIQEKMWASSSRAYLPTHNTELHI